MEYTEGDEFETEGAGAAGPDVYEGDDSSAGEGGGTEAPDNPDVPAVPDAPDEPDAPAGGEGGAEPSKSNFCVTCKYKVSKASSGRLVPQLPTHPLNLNTILLRNIQKNMKNAVPAASDLGCVHPEHVKINFVNGETSPGACSDYNTYGECLFWESAEESASGGGGLPDEADPPEADE